MNDYQFSPDALQDLKDIWDFIYSDGPDAADKVVEACNVVVSSKVPIIFQLPAILACYPTGMILIVLAFEISFSTVIAQGSDVRGNKISRGMTLAIGIALVILAEILRRSHPVLPQLATITM